ncbi:MAG: LysM peptidoglycan-binding domain-containing protein [Variibacter sp.]|nr:LysM peptidoglycan-binding domain-containing protein [Variibacter sp.]
MQYTVQRGDTLSAIARRFGVPSWQAIYNHPNNAGFRARRPDPNLIYPGDVVFVPDGAGPRPGPSPRPAPPPAQALDYVVPGIVDVIAQPTSLVCWATVYAMMRGWREQSSMGIREAVARIGEKYARMVDNNQPLPPGEFVPFLRAANLRHEPMANPTIERWADMLRAYGLLWVGTMNLDFSGRHSRIVYAISGDGTAEGTRMGIVDPDGGRRYPEVFADFLARYEQGFTYGSNDGYFQIRHY